MGTPDTWVEREVARGRLTRRELLDFCGSMAAMMGIPVAMAPRIAHAVETGKKPTLVWLEFQDCCGNTESFLRASRPGAAEVILDHLSIDYHETIMAAAGHHAEDALKAVTANVGQYIVVVEGSIPAGADGAYCTVGGRAALEIAREVCGNALATIAIGTCAAYGGLPAAAPNPTGAMSVAQAVPGATVLNLPACPANVENLVAVVLYFVTFGRLPPTDPLGRPRFAYGKSIHDNCERRAHFDAGQYVEEFGDVAHRKGYCLFKVGCKGPVTYQNCPVVRWNEGLNWPIGCGHPCIGCAEPNFWDRMTPFYQHLPGIPGFGVASNVDTIGMAAVGAVGAAFAAHGVAKAVRNFVIRDAEPNHGGEKEGGQ